MSGAEEWQGILDPGEEIVWQGAPEPSVRFKFHSPSEPLFFLFFVGFSIFWMAMASMAGGFFWMFGLLFFFVGSYQLVGQHFYKAYLRKNIFYTLTNKRAFIASKNAVGHKSLESYPITSDTPLTLEEGTFTSIYFTTKRAATASGHNRVQKVGFELLADGRTVFERMRKVQISGGEQ